MKISLDVATTTSTEALLLELVGDVSGIHTSDEFARTMMSALRRVIPSDWASVNALSHETGVLWAVADPEMTPQDHEEWGRYGHQNPLAVHFMTSPDGSARRIEDVTTRAEFEATDLHRSLYTRIGMEHQLAFTLPAEPGQSLGVALSRKVGRRAYSEAERTLANRARPFLIQSFRTTLALERLSAFAADAFTPRATAALTDAGLTMREAEVVSHLARGRANADIAASLELSRRTVDKHVERAFRKLGVSSRSAAAAQVWQLLDA
jgi:DNA-binding CsgD family transcriptional regulator